MAPVAGLAGGAFVFVIFFMAFIADLRSLLKLGRFMSFLAFRFLMRSYKFKLGPVMVKPDLFPRRRLMAGFTIFSLRPLVFIVFLMAGETGFGGLFELFLRTCMAFLAGSFQMFSFQGEFRLAVIETDFLPLGGDMAPFAGGAEGAFMFIFLLVAGNAGCFYF